MERFLGVKVQRVARKYTEVLLVGRDRTGESRLTTLTPQQELAEIDLYLLQRKRKDGDVQEVRRLHHFAVRNTRKADGTRPLLSLKANKTGWRRYDVELSKDGKKVDQTTVRVPIRIAPLLSVVTLALVLAAVLLALFTCEPGRSSRQLTQPEQPAETSRLATETPGRDTTSPPPETPDGDTPSGAPETPSSGSLPATPDPAAAAPAPRDEAVQSVPEEITRTFTVYFHPDSNRPMEESRNVLDEIASILANEANKIERVVLEGHTALYGNEAGRERISSGRIEAVEAHAQDAGWNPEEQAERWIRGASAPVTRSMEEQHLNRRAEVTITYRRNN